MKKIYKVTQAQLKTLQEGGTITSGGTTYSYETGEDVAYIVVDPTSPEYRLAQDNDSVQLMKDGTVVSDLSVAYADRSGYSTFSHTLVYPDTDNANYTFNLYDGGTIAGETTFETKVQATGGVMAGADCGVYFTPNTDTLRMYATSSNDYVVNLDCPNGRLFTFSDAANISSRNFIPGTTKTHDLGSSGAFWQNLYLSGNLSDGTNSTSVANIATKSYVTSQGYVTENTKNTVGIGSFSTGTLYFVGTQTAPAGSTSTSAVSYETGKLFQTDTGGLCCNQDFTITDSSMSTKVTFAQSTGNITTKGAIVASSSITAQGQVNIGTYNYSSGAFSNGYMWMQCADNSSGSTDTRIQYAKKGWSTPSWLYLPNTSGLSATIATTSDKLASPYSISFKNASGNTVSYSGSAALDLTGGVYYAATSGSASSATYAGYLGSATAAYTYSGLQTALNNKLDASVVTEMVADAETQNTIFTSRDSGDRSGESLIALLHYVTDTTNDCYEGQIRLTGAEQGDMADCAYYKPYGITYNDTGLSFVDSQAGTLLTTGNLYSTESTLTANSVTTTSSRTYQIQKNSSGKLVVNVPWSNTNSITKISGRTASQYLGTLSYTAQSYGVVLSGITFSGGSYGALYTISGTSNTTGSWMSVSTTSSIQSSIAVPSSTANYITATMAPHTASAAATLSFFVPASTTYYVVYYGNWTYCRYNKFALGI